ncbi:MAG: hypothetical protein RMK19_08565 [Bacteroidia bacterium]|nr:hypothetical protein [Bacteroidia bacterium]
MWRIAIWISTGLFFWGCRQPPPWLKEAPTIGIRIQDDLGRTLYLPKPPQRVALAAPEALPLWEKANLLDRLVGACYGSGDNLRLFYLLCDDSLALTEALYKAQADWVWVSRRNQIASFPEEKIFVYNPTSPAQWVRHLRLLGQVYNHLALIRLADSLSAYLSLLNQKLQEARRFRVLVLTQGEPFHILTQEHPFVAYIQQVGGYVPYTADSLQPSGLLSKDTLLAFPPEVILVPEKATDLLNDFLRVYPEMYASPAIQYQRIFAFPSALVINPHAEPFKTLYLLLRILHPEVAGQDTV